MAKLPAFQFYPGDWLKDANLRRCTPAARGVFMDMLCLMFESEERGVLASGGTPWSDDEVAAAIAGREEVVLAGIRELCEKRVVSRDQRGALLSRRMVRDEAIRRVRAIAGQKGGNASKSQATSAAKSKQTGKQKEGSSSSVSSSVSKQKHPPNPPRGGKALAASAEQVEAVWTAYPSKGRNGKARVSKQIRNAIRDDGFEAVLAGVRRYAGSQRVANGFVKDAATFFGPSKHWQSEFEVASKPALDRNAASLRAHNAKLARMIRDVRESPHARAREAAKGMTDAEILENLPVFQSGELDRLVPAAEAS